MHLKCHPLVQAMALAMLLAPLPMSAWAETSGETQRNEAEQKALDQSDTAISANTASANTNASINTLPTIVISAHPLDRTASDIATPVSVVEHDQLASGATTLGQALAGQPGIHADSFGGGASRPVIRGQTAPRVKVLSDGSEVMDASAISPDHAVTVEPLLSEKIEVLRGPSTLLYGSGAIGGAINVLDNKIPTRMPENGLEGEVNLRGNTVADEKAAAAAVTVGLGEQFALHVEGVKRDANDYKVRGYTPEGENEKRVDGSYATGENASVGLSWIGERGFAGLAFTQRKDEYGLPGHSHEYESCHPHGTHLHCGGHDEEGEDEATHDHDDGHDHEHDHDHSHEAAPWIELDSKRVDFRAEYAQPFTGFDKIRVRAGYTDYQHDEIEEGSVATQFNNKGYDGRIELTHVPVAGFEGVLGLQYARSDFEANGEEAFLPKTLTENISAFLLEHYQWKDVHFELGARQEWQTINPELGLAKFSTQDYDDTATSASFAATWEFVPDYALALSLAHSERMPNAQELYANGGHFATNTYELGDANLSNEKSNNVELSLRKTAGDFTIGLSAYHNQVDDYIYARTLDAFRIKDFEDFRLIQYTQADATFNGVEAESSYRIDDNYTATLFGDYVRAKLDSSDAQGNRNLPRIPAARLGSRIQANWDALGGQLGGALEYAHVFKQNDIADYESTTADYNLINATLAYDGELNARNSYRLYLQMNNLLDEKYVSHSSFLSTIPQPGRNFTAGVQLKF